MSAAQSEIKEGMVVGGRYQIGDLLGMGDLGNTYVCRDLGGTALKYVAKILNLKSMDPGSVGFSGRDLSLLLRLRHSGLVRILDFGVVEDSGALFLIEELIEGRDLYSGTEAMDAQSVLSILAEISNALQYLHACGMVHGDLKPSNVILTDCGDGNSKLKLLDFGLTRLARRDMQPNGHGRLAYAAPEILLGGEPTAASDLYSLGILLYQLLSRRLPFDDEDLGFLIQKHLQGNVDLRPIAGLKDAGCLTALIGRMLDKDPGMRPATAGEIRTIVSASLGHEDPEVSVGALDGIFSTSEFVGRDKEMSFLQECASQVRVSGRGRTVFISGEAGAGKSRCMEELRSWALLEGWRVVEGACSSSEESSYEPYRQILARTECAEGEAIFRFGETPQVMESESFDGYSEFAAGQYRDLLTRELVRRLMEHPTMLFLHDFHQADEATSTVLDYLSSDIQAHPVFMCVSLRPGEETRGTLAKIVDMAVRQERGEILRLEPLAQESIEQIIAGMTGNSELKNSLGPWIFSRVGGNPFFLEETLKHLVEQGVLHREMGKWEIAGNGLQNLEIPASVSIVLQRRLAQLSFPARELAAWMSLFRRAVSIKLLGRVMSQPDGDIGDALPELIRRQMVHVEVKNTEQVVDFCHALIAEAIRGDLSKRQSQKMHRKIAEALEREGAKERNLAELAMHYIEGKSKASSIRDVLAAASQYRAEFAHESALRCFEYVFQNPACLSGIEFCRAAIEASDTMFALGMPTRAIRLLKTVLRRHKGIGADLRARMYMQLALSYQHLGNLHLQEVWCKKGLKITRKQSTSETRLTEAFLWTELALSAALQSRPKQGLSFLDKAIRSCPDKGIVMLGGRIQSLYASLHRVACNFREAKTASKRAIIDLHCSEGAYIASSAYSTLGGVLTGLGRLLAALEAHDHAVSLSDTSRSVVRKSQALGNLAECLCRLGRTQEAQYAAERAIKSVCESNNPSISHAFNAILAEIRFSAGDFQSAFQIITKLCQEEGSSSALMPMGQAHYVAAGLNFYFGNIKEALNHIDQLNQIQTREAPLYEYELAEALRARILFEQGASQKALKSLYSLDSKVARKHWPYHRCIIKLHISEILINENKMDVAEKYAKNALRLAKAMHAASLISQCHLLLGFIYSPVPRFTRMAGSHYPADPINKERPQTQKAIEELQLCCHTAEGSCDADLLWRAFAELAFINRSLGKSDDCLIQAQRAYELLCKLEDQIPSEMLPAFCSAFNRSQVKLELARTIEAGKGSERSRRISAGPVQDDEHARALLRVSAAVNSSRGLEPILELILDQLIASLGMERAFVFLCNRSTGELELARGRNARKESVPMAEGIDGAITKMVYMESMPILSANARFDPRINRQSSACDRLGMLLCAPLKASGRVLGVLYADSSSPAEGLSESLIDLFATLCNFTAIALDNVPARQQLATEVQHVPQEREAYSDIIGASAAVYALRNRISLASASPLDILVTGESGTGKELVARAIYRTGRRRSGKFVAVDCGSLSDTLAEAELFGYRKGAFTGAIENRQGIFEAAQGGIVFLDEMPNLPFRLQAKLLRVLQEREIRRIGETIPRKIDIQIIAATNKDLLEEVRAGRFRRDLLYRLKAMEIRVPSLRERSEDIPLLIEWFLRKTAEAENGRFKQFQPQALKLLNRYFYPGNIRELKNIVVGSYYSTTNASIGTEELPPEVRLEDIADLNLESSTANRLYSEILEGKGSFDDLVKEPFLERKFGSSVVRGVIRRALKDAGGKYRDAFMRMRLSGGRYPVTMQFLKRNKCYLDFRPFRRNCEKTGA